jgi:hypothetical protein
LASRHTPYVLVAVAALVLAIVIFTIQLWRFGPDIRRLNRFETLTQLAHFAENQKAMTLAFGEATAASNRMRAAAEEALNQLDGVREMLSELFEKMSERDAEKIVELRLEDAQSERQPGVLWSRPAAGIVPPGSSPKSADALYKDMMAQWDKFLAVFRQRLIDANITPVMNRIGRMTYQLTDKRRRSPLPLETAELITALHSQYRRYTRLQGTREQWMTREVRDSFVKLVETAIEELNKPVGPLAPDCTNATSVAPAPTQLM